VVSRYSMIVGMIYYDRMVIWLCPTIEFLYCGNDKLQYFGTVEMSYYTIVVLWKFPTLVLW